MSVCRDACVYVCVCVSACTRVVSCAYVRMSVCRDACVYVRVCVSVLVCVRNMYVRARVTGTVVNIARVYVWPPLLL